MKYITIVGSRKTPIEIVNIYKQIFSCFDKNEFIFRSGNALGFDQVISDFPTANKEIYLPYKTFGPKLNIFENTYVPKTQFNNYQDAVNLVRKLHPNKNLSDMNMQYLARDVYQVLGKDLNTPSDIVYCWTEDGVNNVSNITFKTGGTAMVIRVAEVYKIPVINLNQK